MWALRTNQNQPPHPSSDSEDEDTFPELRASRPSQPLPVPQRPPPVAGVSPPANVKSLWVPKNSSPPAAAPAASNNPPKGGEFKPSGLSVWHQKASLRTSSQVGGPAREPPPILRKEEPVSKGSASKTAGSSANVVSRPASGASTGQDVLPKPTNVPSLARTTRVEHHERLVNPSSMFPETPKVILSKCADCTPVKMAMVESSSSSMERNQSSSSTESTYYQTAAVSFEKDCSTPEPVHLLRANHPEIDLMFRCKSVPAIVEFAAEDDALVPLAGPPGSKPIFIRELAIRSSLLPLRVKKFVPDIQRLSIEAFDEDVIKGISRKSNWRLGLLVESDYSALNGFISYRYMYDLKSLDIAKFAVPKQLRGQGHGKRILMEILKVARNDNNIRTVSLSSLPESVKFYSKFGFKKFKRSLLDTPNAGGGGGGSLSIPSPRDQEVILSSASVSLDVSNESRVLYDVMPCSKETPSPPAVTTSSSTTILCTRSEEILNSTASADTEQWMYVEGQVYMEYRCPPKKAASVRSRR